MQMNNMSGVDLRGFGNKFFKYSLPYNDCVLGLLLLFVCLFVCFFFVRSCFCYFFTHPVVEKLLLSQFISSALL